MGDANTMKKLLSLALAGLMTLTLIGCKIEIDANDVTPQDGGNWEVLQEDGTIWIEGFDENALKSFMHRTSEVKDYHIVIQSGGGSCFNTVAMINRIQELQAQGAYITTETYGIAFSAGSYLFLTGDERIIHSGAGLMFHGCGLTSYGTRVDQRKLMNEGDKPDQMDMYDLLSDVDENFVNLLRRAGLEDNEIRDWMFGSDNNFMNWRDAVELNIATAWIGDDGDIESKPLELDTPPMDPRHVWVDQVEPEKDEDRNK
jgi:ATP-dependent protease ClpP protease subunit